MKKLITLLLTLAVMAALSAYTYAPSWTAEQTKLHQIANMARELGLPEDSPIIEEAQRLWWESEWGDDLRILANVIYHEAPYCTDRHQQLVAQVVLNRVADPRFPDTVAGVVSAKGQYNPSYTRNLPRLDTDNPEMQRCLENARAALEGRVDCPEDVVFQSEFEHLGAGVYEAITVDTGYYRSTTYFNYG